MKITLLFFLLAQALCSWMQPNSYNSSLLKLFMSLAAKTESADRDLCSQKHPTHTMTVLSKLLLVGEALQGNVRGGRTARQKISENGSDSHSLFVCSSRGQRMSDFKGFCTHNSGLQECPEKKLLRRLSKGCFAFSLWKCPPNASKLGWWSGTEE